MVYAVLQLLIYKYMAYAIMWALNQACSVLNWESKINKAGVCLTSSAQNSIHAADTPIRSWTVICCHYS